MPVLLICAGLALRSVARLAVVGLLIRGEYVGGGPVDLLWTVGYLLLAVAALCPPAASSGAVRLTRPASPAERAVPGPGCCCRTCRWRWR